MEKSINEFMLKLVVAIDQIDNNKEKRDKPTEDEWEREKWERHANDYADPDDLDS